MEDTATRRSASSRRLGVFFLYFFHGLHPVCVCICTVSTPRESSGARMAISGVGSRRFLPQMQDSWGRCRQTSSPCFARMDRRRLHLQRLPSLEDLHVNNSIMTAASTLSHLGSRNSKNTAGSSMAGGRAYRQRNVRHIGACMETSEIDSIGAFPPLHEHISIASHSTALHGIFGLAIESAQLHILSKQIVIMHICPKPAQTGDGDGTATEAGKPAELRAQARDRLSC